MFMQRGLLLLLIILLIAFLLKQKQNYWCTDLVVAKNYATLHDQDILLVFAGSNWCRPCIEFKRRMLDKVNFWNNQPNGVVILYLEYPTSSFENFSRSVGNDYARLQQTFNPGNIFPNVVLLDVNEQILVSPNCSKYSVETFAAELSPLLESIFKRIFHREE